MDLREDRGLGTVAAPCQAPAAELSILVCCTSQVIQRLGHPHTLAPMVFMKEYAMEF